MRIDDHPILGKTHRRKEVTILVDGVPLSAHEGEPIAVALLAAGRRALHYSVKRGEPRGMFCALGQCNDCVMTVDGQPNVRTCITPVRDGMRVETQIGLGQWRSLPPAQGEED